MEPLSSIITSFAISIAANIVTNKICNIKKVDREIKDAFEKAKKDWSQHDLTYSEERELKNYLKEIQENPLVFDEEKNSGKQKFYNYFRKRLAETQYAKDYLKDIKDENSFREILKELEGVKNNTERILALLDSNISPMVFWDEWSKFNGIELIPEILTLGREVEKEKLITCLKRKANVTYLKSSTKNEAIAFIIACALRFEEVDKDAFFQKAVIVKDETNLRAINKDITNLPLIIIYSSNDYLPVGTSISKGHHVFVPLGADDECNGEPIILPILDREGQIESLQKMGFSWDESSNLSKEAGRSITLLKKLLKFPHYKVKWHENENLKDLIPAMLIGRWTGNSVGDREIIEFLSGFEYDEYEKKLLFWRDVEEPPVIQIGHTWRLTSPLDLWTNFSKILTKQDFDNLQLCFIETFANGNPVIDNDKIPKIPGFQQEHKYSSWAREGLIQSLVLTALYGKNFELTYFASPQNWVDSVFAELFDHASEDLWVSLNDEMPLIAEASPKIFLESVLKSLVDKNPAIMKMFIEEEGFMSPQSNHTGLLWALESLAWMPDFFYKSSLVLLKLSIKDPGGNLSNRPISSLVEIFKPWHFQTLATFEDRMQVLRKIVSLEPNEGWKLLMKLLPEFNDIGGFTYKMRWRLFNENVNIRYSNKEIWDTHSELINCLISIFDSSEEKLGDLINASFVFYYDEDRNKIIDFVDTKIPTVKHSTQNVRNVIRLKLSHHRSCPDADWAFRESILLKYEALFKKLEPTDLIKKYIWLFNEQNPQFISGYIYNQVFEICHLTARQIT